MDHVQKTNQLPPPDIHHSTTSFPILAIALISILILALLLISYYIFVIKCCLNIHRVDVLSRFLSPRDTVSHPSPYPVVDNRNRGLDSSIIQAIPVIPFKRRHTRSFSKVECAVCLTEFVENEKLRAIPSCQHLFHVDCIDVWLQGNENCPLCRRSVSTAVSQMEYSKPKRDNFAENDEDYVIIESGDPTPLTSKRERKLNHVSSMGDECINSKGRNDRFDIQPIRRSFSMDSANDRQLYLSVKEIIEKNIKNRTDGGLVSDVSSSSGRIKRGLFSFGSGKGSSRSAVLPIEEP